MSKSKSKGNSDKKGKDWTTKLQEVILSGQDAQHVVLPLEGGSDNGEFPIVGQKLKSYKVSLKSGKLHEGDVIVEVQGQKVAGYTQLDVNQWIAQVSKNGTPIMIKTVKQGLLPKDLRQYLNTRFTKGSEDHNLQQTIRDNLYLRTVPCTSRKPRPGEINGVDYTFLSIEQFRALEAKGELLESGRYNRATTHEHRYQSDSASEHKID